MVSDQSLEARSLKLRAGTQRRNRNVPALKDEKVICDDSTVMWSRERKANCADSTTWAAAVATARSAVRTAKAARTDLPRAGRQRDSDVFMGVFLSFAGIEPVPRNKRPFSMCKHSPIFHAICLEQNLEKYVTVVYWKL